MEEYQFPSSLSDFGFRYSAAFQRKQTISTAADIKIRSLRRLALRLFFILRCRASSRARCSRKSICRRLPAYGPRDPPVSETRPPERLISP